MTHELTGGSIRKTLILFAIPLLFSQLFQTLYNTADTVIIGYFLGDHSLAAVGSVSALFDLIVGFSTGFGQGFGVIAARKFGAQDYSGFKKSVALSIVLSAGIGLLMSILMVSCMPSILHLLRTPDDIFSEACSYIQLISGGLLITIFYNLTAGLLRSAGDSRTPLYVLILSSLLNIVLDYLFITRFDASVAATAWATLIAQAVSLTLCLAWIIMKKRNLLPCRHDFVWDGQLAGALAKTGLSMALMSSIVSIGTLVLQTGINPMGTPRIGGHTAARKLLAILNLPIAAMMLALSPFVAQNMGGDCWERAEKGIAFANRLGMYYSILLSLLVFFAADWMIAILSGSQDRLVIETGSLYLKTNIPFLPALVILVNLRTSLQSMLMNVVPVISSIIELAGKLLFTWAVVPAAGYAGVCATEPTVWIVMAVFLSVSYLRYSVLYRQGIEVHLLR